MRRISECRACGAPMIWARTGRGKRMPLDAEPTSDGMFVLEGDDENPVTHRLANYAASLYKGEKFAPHWSTCPKADQFKRKRDQDP